MLSIPSLRRYAVNDLPSTIFWLRLIQLLIAIPLLALAGQGATFALTRLMGQPPRENIVYRLFQLVASPVVKPCRWIAPRFIPDRHLPLVAFSVLLVAYVWVMLEIGSTCARHGLAVAECLQQR
jgi:ABC-type uncharacterized transport system permease subunit